MESTVSYTVAEQTVERSGAAAVVLFIRYSGWAAPHPNMLIVCSAVPPLGSPQELLALLPLPLVAVAAVFAWHKPLRADSINALSHYIQ